MNEQNRDGPPNQRAHQQATAWTLIASERRGKKEVMRYIIERV